jgi:large subunit ribosomal protein L23
MALFSKKSETETPVVAETPVISDAPAATPVFAVAKNRQAVIIPRLSEKTTGLEKLNKYVFRVEGKSNKVDIRKALEKTYGVKVDKVNIVTVKSRARRYGRTSGRIGSFKKAIVTLKPDSKKIEIAEAI